MIRAQSKIITGMTVNEVLIGDTTNLREDDLDVGRLRAARIDPEAAAEYTHRETDDKDGLHSPMVRTPAVSMYFDQKQDNE